MALKSFLSAILLLVAVEACMAIDVILDDKVTVSSPKSLSCGDVVSLGNGTVIWNYTQATGLTNTTEVETLELNITDNTQTGIYACYFNGEQKEIYIAAKLSKPVISDAQKSVTYNNGDKNRKLTCETVGSYPEPAFAWMTRGLNKNEARILAEENTNYYVQTNGTKSVLTIYNVTYNEAVYFICDVQNVAGNGTVEILVRVKDKYAAVWPFLGIVIEVVILIAIIFLYERHSKKAAVKTDQVNVAEDQKPLNRDEGMEIRNRNGNKEVEKT